MPGNYRPGRDESNASSTPRKGGFLYGEVRRMFERSGAGVAPMR